jgi:hypothetical protein
MNIKRARYFVDKIGAQWVIMDRQTKRKVSLHQYRWQARMTCRQLNTKPHLAESATA